jgi:hypothetical protein
VCETLNFTRAADRVKVTQVKRTAVRAVAHAGRQPDATS